MTTFFRLFLGQLSIDYVSCIVACVLMIAAFLMLATQKVSVNPYVAQKGTSQSFIFGNGILFGLLQNCSPQFAVSWEILPLYKRHVFTSRIRTYNLITATGRMLGILLFGHLISVDTSSINDIYTTTITCVGFTIVSMTILIIAATRRVYPVGTCFAESPFPTILSRERYDVNVF